MFMRSPFVSRSLDQSLVFADDLLEPVGINHKIEHAKIHNKIFDSNSATVSEVVICAVRLDTKNNPTMTQPTAKTRPIILSMF